MGCIYRHTQKGKQRPTWWVKYRSAGRWQYESSHSHERKRAVRLLKLREGDSARGLPVTSDIGRMKFEEAVIDLVNYHKARNRTTTKMERRIAIHLAPLFARRKMADISVADCEAYIVHRAEASTATVNRELSLLKQMFSLAVRAGKLMTKPYIELRPEHNARQGFFEHEQFLSVQKHLSDDLVPVITVAFFTGWRVNSELLTLQWKQVDQRAGQLRLEPGTTKNKEGRTFPYGRIPELKAAIDGQWAEHERLRRAGRLVPWVFHRNGKRIATFLKAFRAACIKAGCPGRIPHDFRRTAVRNLERAGVPRSQAMKLTGHLTESVYRRYAIASEADLEVAAERLALFTKMFTSTTKAR